MGRPSFRTNLEETIRTGNRTIEEHCAAFERTASDMGEDATLSVRQLARWMAGEVDSARPVMRRVAERYWGRSFADLLSAPGTTVAAPAATVAPPPQIIEDAAMIAAGESARHSSTAGKSVSSMTIEQLLADLRRLANRYGEISAITALIEARNLRNDAYALLEQTRRPTQLADLYLAAGQACGLMSDASFDMAVWEAAEDQARSAYTYAELIGHDGLRAWARGTQALIAYWTGQPRRAVNLAESAIAAGPAGVALARLRGIEARAWSHLGGETQVQVAVIQADRAMEAADGHDDLFDGVGGQFRWSGALHAACAGTALLGVGIPDLATARFSAALDAARDDPAGVFVSARVFIDIATAEVAGGRIDDACAALAVVWDVPADRRRHSLTGRLDGLARTLTAAPWRNQREAQELRDQIEVFIGEAIRQRALPMS
jgi:hypothetical protein